MSKAVLMSIKPQFCEMIFRGEKTIEIRKRAPKLKPPFKVYVYCTKGDPSDAGDDFYIHDIENYKKFKGNGKVVGEFVCDQLVRVLDYPEVFARHPLFHTKALEDACLTQEEAIKYSDGKELFGLHISCPRLYKKPKYRRRFIRPCPNDLICEECENYFEIEGRCCAAALQITRPPQSWCYVEEWDFQN